MDLAKSGTKLIAKKVWDLKRRMRLTFVVKFNSPVEISSVNNWLVSASNSQGELLSEASPRRRLNKINLK